MAQKEPQPITLTEKEAAELRAADLDALTVKGQICDLTESIIVAEDNRRKLFDQLYAKQAAYRARSLKMGTRHGIDFDLDPQVTGYTWAFDHGTMTWTPTKVEGVDPAADVVEEVIEAEPKFKGEDAPKSKKSAKSAN